MAYKYFIKQIKDEGFYFGLYPNNNNRQPMGRSIYYPTYADAEEARKVFIAEVKAGGKRLFDKTRLEDGKYMYKCSSITGFHRVHIFWQAKSRDNCVEQIIKNIDAPLKMCDMDDIKTH